MQKLKNSILDRMIAEHLPSKEIDFLLYVSRFQDDSGQVPGVHYRAASKTMGMSFQSFYDVKNALVKKKFIKSEKNDRIDHDIMICGNYFQDETDLQAGYINTNQQMFLDPDFYKMKAGSKLLAMFLLKCSRAGNGTFIIGTEKFYRDYTNLFHVSVRVLRHYLKEVRKFFSIGIKDKKYYMSPLKKAYAKSGQTEIMNQTRHHVEVVCRRNRIRPQKEELQDVCGLIRQYASIAAMTKIRPGSLVGILVKAVEKSIEVINPDSDGGKNRIRMLRPSLIHKIFRQELDLLKKNGPGVYTKGHREMPEQEKKNKFNNFLQRDYDYDALEQVLLNADPLPGT